jgi:excisionase family DNA binding protein
MSEPFKPALMSVAHTATYLGRSEREIWRLIERKEIEAVGTRRKRFILVSSIDGFIERQRKQAQALIQRRAQPSA